MSVSFNRLVSHGLVSPRGSGWGGSSTSPRTDESGLLELTLLSLFMKTLEPGSWSMENEAFYRLKVTSEHKRLCELGVLTLHQAIEQAILYDSCVATLIENGLDHFAAHTFLGLAMDANNCLPLVLADIPIGLPTRLSSVLRQGVIDLAHCTKARRLLHRTRWFVHVKTTLDFLGADDF